MWFLLTFPLIEPHGRRGLKVLSASPAVRRKPPHYLTAPCLQSWHFVKRESPRDSSIYLITNPPGLILGPVHLRSIAELSPSSIAGRIHLHSGGTGVMDVLTAVTTAEGD